MNNIFKIGGQVTGDSFIGREAFVQELHNTYVLGQDNVARAYVGLPRMGKTSAIKNSFYDLPDNLIYIYEDLSMWDSYNELWQGIVLPIGGYLKAHQMDDEDVMSSIELVCKESILWPMLVQNVRDIFSYLAEFDVRTVLVLDEFDQAARLFEKKVPRFELFREIISDASYRVSTITISRRNLYTIEEGVESSSTFHGVFDSRPFRGFDEHDMEEYFHIFEERYRIALSEEQRNQIVYYAGNAPLLLATLGYYIVNTATNGEPVDIDEIFRQRCKSIDDYYNDCSRRLEEDGDLKRIVPFVLGPKIGVTKRDEAELFNLGYFRVENDRLIVISEYFTEECLRDAMMSISLWDNVINVEKEFKKLLEREKVRVVDHYGAVGQSTNEVQCTILENTSGIDHGDISRYDKFIKSNKSKHHVDSTYLDVMSLNSAISIIAACWEIFAPYFNNDLYANWQGIFGDVAFARNPLAHGHEEYLSESKHRAVDAYCEQIFDILSRTIKTVEPLPDVGWNGWVSPEGQAHSLADATAGQSEAEQPEQEFDMWVESYSVEKKNLRGTIGEKQAVITKDKLQDYSENERKAMVHTMQRVVLDGIQKNPEKYLVHLA